jgi:acid stress-induced BolA-like protein IbaG/YrbA
VENNGLKGKVRDALKNGYFGDENDFVDVSDGYDNNLHVVVVSRKFEGKRLSEKQDLIWSQLFSNLSEEDWGRVTLSVGVTPEEIKAL